MIRCTHVGARLGDREILTDISLEVADGAWLCLIGPNGAGKTTLLRALLGMLPYSGSITIDGVERRGDIDRNVAFVPQRPETPAGMTVIEYVALGRAKKDGWGRESAKGRAVIREALERLMLMGLRDQYVTRLSGGEFQRVLIARAIAQEPDLVLLDEPTSALDLHHQVAALDEIEALRSGGATIVSTMHDITLATMYADRFALLKQGRLLLDDEPREAVRAPQFMTLFDDRVRVLTLDEGMPIVLPTRDRPTP